MITRSNFDEDVAPNSNSRNVDFIPLTLRYFWLLLLLAGVGVGAAYLHFLKQPPTYQSSSTILLTSERQQQAIPFGTAPGMAPDARQIMPHSLLIRSPVVVANAVEKYKLNNLPAFSGGGNPTGKIISGLSISPTSETPDVLRLSFAGSDPESCKVALDAVIDSYRSFLGDTQQSISEDVLKLITEAKDVLLGQLNQKEMAYRTFRQEAPLLFTQGAAATNIHKERLSKIEAARSALLIALHEKTAELESLKKAIAQGGSREALALIIRSAIAASDKNGLPQQKSPTEELFPLVLEEQMLLETLGPDHPKVIGVQKRIEITRKFLTDTLAEAEQDAAALQDRSAKPKDLIGLYLESLQHGVEFIQQKQSEMDLLFNREKDAAKSLSTFENQDETYRSDISRTSQLFNSVVKRLDEISLVKNYGGYKMSVISAPGIGYQTGPFLSRFLLAGAAAGILAGFVMAFLLEANDRSFRTPEEVQIQLGLPVIGHIPVIEFTKVDRQSKETKGTIDPSVVAYLRPKSRLAEAYRAIRTALYFSTRGEPHKVIQVTSPNPGDGKTTLCSNLAVSIAQSGKRVLLIDADFRRPRIHKLFGLSSKVGISSVIAGTAEPPDAIQQTQIENLSAMACGPRPDNPAELLTGKRFEELLAVLREQFDFVLIDTPPLLAVTDPSAVAPRVDGVLVTIRITKRTRAETQRATELLANVGANIIGVVVNGIGGNDGHGYNGYRYGYRYGYGMSGYSYAYGDGKTGVYYSDEDKRPAPETNGHANDVSARREQGS